MSSHFLTIKDRFLSKTYILFCEKVRSFRIKPSKTTKKSNFPYFVFLFDDVWRYGYITNYFDIQCPFSQDWLCDVSGKESSCLVSRALGRVVGKYKYSKQKCNFLMGVIVRVDALTQFLLSFCGLILNKFFVGFGLNS